MNNLLPMTGEPPGSRDIILIVCKDTNLRSEYVT